MDMETIARNILMPSNPNAQTVPGPYKRDQLTMDLRHTIQSLELKIESLQKELEIERRYSQRLYDLIQNYSEGE